MVHIPAFAFPQLEFLSLSKTSFPDICPRRIAVSSILSLSLLISRPVIAASPPPLDPQHTLAEQVWTLLDRYYLDRTFNSLPWNDLREQLLSTPLPNATTTYSTLRKFIRRLDDRYTRLLNPSDMRTIRRFDVSGVGLLLTTDAHGDLSVATAPVKGTSAADAGILQGDVLKQVDGVNVEGKAAFEVSEMMQGKDGEDMELTFRDKGKIVLTRHFEGGTQQSVRSKLVDTDEGKMGYIRLSEFRASSREEVANAIDDLDQKGAEWFVLDLRGNRGGVFEGALEIAGLFEGKDIPVVRVLGREDGGARDMPLGDEIFNSRVVGGTSFAQKEPDLAIIVDAKSASSSEVLAGGLRETCRAALVGERTFGKGLIQGVFGLSDGGGLIITVAEYRTPEGGRIQGMGLAPDIEREPGQMAKVGKIFGVEKLDEMTVDVSRKEVQDVVTRCKDERGKIHR